MEDIREKLYVSGRYTRFQVSDCNFVGFVCGSDQAAE